MEIHQLEYVMAVVKHHHFSYAADSVCITQSTLSHQIKRLEEELGVRLFERSTRKVRLTPAGREFANFASNILELLYQSRKVMQQYSDADKGEITVGAIPIMGILGFIPLLMDFQKTYPNIHMTFKEAGGETLLDDLQNEKIDTAFLIPPANVKNYPDLQFYTLFIDDLVLLTYKSHPLAAERSVDLKLLRNDNFVLMNTNDGMLRANLDVCRKSGFTPNVVFQSGQVDTVAAVVAEGMGISILSSRVAKHVKSSGLSIIKIKGAPKKITSLALRKDFVQSPVVNVFSKFILSRFNG
jgi:LysR family hydrogen peroxide-inducible transcriptional activator